MSDSSPDFDRSQLERKDREQLVVIATTLGKKPPTRARKAEIVDLILELAGVTTAGAASSAPETPADAAGATTPRETTTSGSDDPGASSASSTPDESKASAPSGAQSPGASESSPKSASIDRRGPRPSAGPDRSAADGESSGGSNGDRSRGERGVRNVNGATQHGGDKASTEGDKSRISDRPKSDPDNGGDRKGGADAGHGGAASGNGDGHDGDDTDNADNQSDAGGRRRRRRGRGAGPGNEGTQTEPDPIDVEGILDLRDDGYGFLRLHGYLAHRDDSYVSVKQVRQFGLRKGDRIKGLSRQPTRSEKNPALLRIDEVNGAEPTLARERPKFAELTPEYPTEPLRFEHRDTIVDMTARIIDLVAPIGKGQRGLIVAPPKSGKTTILKTIARAIEQNHPDAHLMVLLVDERPEEVTDFQRWVGDGEVVASTFDRPAEEHTVVAELAIERAKRIAEAGGDVVLLVDGITRLTRAYNLTVKESGRLMSGGIDAAAIWPAKRFFGAARKLAEGGSLTILATALVDTNSRMDDHIFEEFKGTGNAELRLDRRLAESRVFPAIDVAGSGTRHEELLFTKPEQVQIAKLRRVLAGVPEDSSGPGAAMNLLIERLQAFKSNEAFLAEVAKS